MTVSLIVAMTRSRVIGRAGGLPWRLSADLKRFKSLTMGHHLIMGSRTFFSLGKLLPGRISLVLSRGHASPYDFSFERQDETGRMMTPPLYDEVFEIRSRGEVPPQEFIPFARVNNLAVALKLAADDPEPFVIGGGEIFELALPFVSRLYVTWVEADVPGDTYFPSLNLADWHLVHSEPIPADAKNDYDTTYCIYDRN